MSTTVPYTEQGEVKALAADRKDILLLEAVRRILPPPGGETGLQLRRLQGGYGGSDLAADPSLLILGSDYGAVREKMAAFAKEKGVEVEGRRRGKSLEIAVLPPAEETGHPFALLAELASRLSLAQEGATDFFDFCVSSFDEQGGALPGLLPAEASLLGAVCLEAGPAFMTRGALGLALLASCGEEDRQQLLDHLGERLRPLGMGLSLRYDSGQLLLRDLPDQVQSAADIRRETLALLAAFDPRLAEEAMEE